MNIVFFTGAGVSEESGIPTFRGDETSLWSKYDVEVVASTYGLQNHLKDVLDFHNEARELISTFAPNYCHKKIAELEKEHKVTVITTNIDELHERAGSTNVIHLHGNIFQVCDIERNDPYRSSEDIQEGDLHPITNLQLRHNTVLFEENLEVDCMRLYNDVVAKADYLVIIGSSLFVYPSSHITEYNKNIIYLGPELPQTKNHINWKTIQKKACEGIDEVLEIFRK